jgi:6,7-dimethyl-8-ribityllumazine synthase
VGEAPETRFVAEQREALASQRWAVCVATFYRDFADRLIAGAREGFAEAGVEADAVDVHEVPGAFELPLAAQFCAETGAYAGVACLGVVIRGETDHYDFVCAEAARGISAVSLQSGLPVAFGVITCDTREQAEARSGGGKRDQGRNAAEAIMRMHLLSERLEAELDSGLDDLGEAATAADGSDGEE